MDRRRHRGECCRLRLAKTAPHGRLTPTPLGEAGRRSALMALCPVRGLRMERPAEVVIAGLAVLPNLRRGYYEIATEAPHQLRVAAAFAELTKAI